jgi:hypothetical protein
LIKAEEVEDLDTPLLFAEREASVPVCLEAPRGRKGAPEGSGTTIHTEIR